MTQQLQLSFDPVRHTQQIFRALLDAQARPGTIALLPAKAADAPISGWAAGILLTLCDIETTLAVELGSGSDEIFRYVYQRVAAPSSPAEKADFVLADGLATDASLITRLKRGSLAFPEDGATVVLLVDALGAGGLRLGLSGPGCPKGSTLDILGLQPSIIQAREEAVRDFPCGVDVLLVDVAGRVAALPRSTAVTIVPEGER